MTEHAEPTMGEQLAETLNANRAAEAADAKHEATSAFEALLQQPFGSGDTGKSAAKEGLDYLLDKWDELMRVGGHLITTKMVRKGLGSAAEAALIMALGRALRVDPIVALNNIYVVNNKPTCESKLLAGLIFREHGPNAIRYVDLTAERAVIDFTRRGGETQRFTFTMDDAERAGLAKKGGVWAQYPQFMLRHRCMSMGGNAVFPDVTCGMITPEEMGLPVKVDDDGNVTVDQSQLDTPPAPRAAKPKSAPKRAAPATVDDDAVTRLSYEDEPIRADKIPTGTWVELFPVNRIDGGWLGCDHINGGIKVDGDYQPAPDIIGKTPIVWVTRQGESEKNGRPWAIVRAPRFKEEAHDVIDPGTAAADPPPSREHKPTTAKGDDPVADAMWLANDAGKRLIASHSASREATLRAEVYGRDEHGAAHTHFGTPDAALLLEFLDKADVLIREKGGE